MLYVPGFESSILDFSNSNIVEAKELSLPASSLLSINLIINLV